MKLHRDAATTPAEMAYYQTPPTERSTWRADLGKIGIASAIVGIIGTFLVISLYLLTRDLRIVGAGIWLTGLVIVGYLAWYGLQLHQDVSARNRLDRARMRAEQDALTMTAIDTNDDGKADAAEVEAFVNYVRRLHRGEPSTAAYAQQKAGIAGPDWTDYKNWLVGKGYANIVARRGGEGFALKPSVFRTPWPKLEQQLRARVQAGLGDGLTITDTRSRGPIDRVSTLED